MDSRVDDYLNDKLQTTEDIDNVDTLLRTVQTQQELLKKQLEEAKLALNNARKASNEHAALVKRKAEGFERQQMDIDQRLQAITNSTTSDEAVRRFESSMGKLRRLEVATGYIELLQEVDNLGDESRRSLKSAPRSSIGPYLRLRTIATALKEAQPAAEGAAPHLVDQVGQQVSSLYQDLRSGFETEFQQTLDLLGWPSKGLNLSHSMIQTWTEQVETLLDLKEPMLWQDLCTSPGRTDSEALLLLPLELMVRPLAMRFHFHFYGDKPTNRFDKPEYFLSHILDLLDQHSGFMSEFLQPVMDRRTELYRLDDLIYTDAVSSFITALLPMVVAKSLSLLPQITSQPQVLSHFIHELMSFDATLRETWGYIPVPTIAYEWKGLTWTILTTHEYFNTWLAAEKQFALSRYRVIRDAEESGELDFDSTDAGSTKPTRGAIRVNDLLETITDRYRGLSSFSQKLRFLIDIQLAIFDDYHSYLHEALQAYLVSTHTAGRLIQGQTKADPSVFGLKGVESLSKIFGSAEYLERKMSDWSDDVFFLELWDELQDRARRNSRLTGSVGRDLSMNEVAAKTSAALNDGTIESDGGALFDETAASYRRLKERSESELVRVFETNIRQSIRPFLRMAIWASLSTTAVDSASLSQSAALDGLTQTLSTLLGYLNTIFASAPLRRITRQVCQAIQREIWDNAITKHSFSASGIPQFRRDISAIEDAIDSAVRIPGEAQRSMRKLEDALTLLSLPIRASNGSMQGADGEGDGWDFEESGDNDNTQEYQDVAETPDSDEDRVWGLWEVEKRVFSSDETAARATLTRMGLNSLSWSDARTVLKRRVELES